MNWTTIRANLATLVEANVTPYAATRPLNAHARRPGEQFRPPLFYLSVAEGPDHNRTSAGSTVDGGLSRVVYTGHLVIGSADSARGLGRMVDELDYYRARHGAGSIYRALLLDGTLAGACSSVLPLSWAGLETIEENGEDQVGDEIEIAIDAV